MQHSFGGNTGPLMYLRCTDMSHMYAKFTMFGGVKPLGLLPHSLRFLKVQLLQTLRLPACRNTICSDQYG